MWTWGQANVIGIERKNAGGSRIVLYQHSEAIYLAASVPKRLHTDFLHGHAPEFCRDGWVVNQFEQLLKLAPPTP